MTTDLTLWKIQMVIPLQRVTRSTSCMYGRYTLSSTLYVTVDRYDGRLETSFDLQYEEKGMREQLWRNRWEYKCTRSIH